MLSPSDLAVLEFESEHAGSSDLKQTRIRDKFGLSQARYYQRLNRIIDDPAAIAAMPLEVHRLQRTRAARLELRAQRRL